MYDVVALQNGRRGAARAAPLPPGEGRGVNGPAQTDLAQGASAFVLDQRGDGVPPYLPRGFLPYWVPLIAHMAEQGRVGVGRLAGLPQPRCAERNISAAG